ncbi:MAG: hypothetical protein AAF610_02525 [Pseudomonadota bacterium]
MSEQTTVLTIPADNDAPRVPLVAVALAAVAAAAVVILVSAESASAWLGVLLGVGVALAGGFVLGQGWRAAPRVAERVSAAAGDTSDAAINNEDSGDALARVDGHEVITPDMLINDDHPTVAMHIPPTITESAPVAIDDKPLAEALAAKDEVIASLESIVNENRDQWANFEAEREALTKRIGELEAELRVAGDLIDEPASKASGIDVGPQVLTEL